MTEPPPSDQRKRPEGSLDILGSLIRGEASLLGLISLTAYVFARYYADGFCKTLGVNPDEAGLGYTVLLRRSLEASAISASLAIAVSVILLYLVLAENLKEVVNSKANHPWIIGTVGASSLATIPIVLLTINSTLRQLAFEKTTLVSTVVLALFWIWMSALLFALAFKKLKRGEPPDGKQWATLGVVTALLVLVGLNAASHWGRAQAYRVLAGEEHAPDFFDPLGILARQVCLIVENEEVSDLESQPLVYLGSDTNFAIFYPARTAIESQPLAVRVPIGKITAMFPASHNCAPAD